LNFDDIIRAIGFAVCHQMPERTIFIRGRPLPVCARDTGFYLGFLISFIYLQLSHRKRENRLSPFLLICIFSSLFLLVLDIITSYLSLRNSTNQIRLFTGLLFGFSLPLFVVPVLNCQLWRDSINSPLLESTLKRFGLLMIFVLSYLLLQGETILSFEILSSVIVGAIFFTLIAVNTMLITLLPRWHRRAISPWQLIVPMVLACILSAIELYLSFLAHVLLLRYFV